MTPSRPLPDAFLRYPLTHRGYHDTKADRPENSMAAIRAAVASGYGIELDLQLSRDGEAVIFHDPDLLRMTGDATRVSALTLKELTGISLEGTQSRIPALQDALEVVDKSRPLLLELKSQPDSDADQSLVNAVSTAMSGYDGALAVMSFSPRVVGFLAEAMPSVPRGLTTEDFNKAALPLGVSEDERADLLKISAFEPLQCAFISHDWRDLDRKRVQELRARGTPVLCWTIKSKRDEAIARQRADGITFEGYAAAFPVT